MAVSCAAVIVAWRTSFAGRTCSVKAATGVGRLESLDMNPSPALRGVSANRDPCPQRRPLWPERNAQRVLPRRARRGIDISVTQPRSLV